MSRFVPASWIAPVILLISSPGRLPAQAVANATTGANVVISAPGRTTLGAIDLDTAGDLALSVTDSRGTALTPKFNYPDTGATRNRESKPQLGSFRF